MCDIFENRIQIEFQYLFYYKFSTEINRLIMFVYIQGVNYCLFLRNNYGYRI